MLKNVFFINIKEIISPNWNLFFKKTILNIREFRNKYDELNDLRNSLMHPEKNFEKNLINRLKYSFEIYQIFKK